MTRSRASCPWRSRLSASSGSRTSSARCGPTGSIRGHAEGRSAIMRYRTSAARSPLQPSVLLAALGAGGAWWHWGRSVAAPPASEAAQPLEPLPAGQLSLAVLPLASPGGDARQERLADGIAEDLIGELGRYRQHRGDRQELELHLQGQGGGRPPGRARARRALRARGQPRDRPRAGAGRGAADRQCTGAQVWSERYDRPLGDVFAVRDELVEQIAGTLLGMAVRLWPTSIERARRKPPQNLDAYDYVRLARAAYRPDKESLAEVRELLGKAIALDPNYPRAYLQPGLGALR